MFNKESKMRLRNVKNAKEIIDSSELVITENVFDNNHKLYIEIGCGKGDFIIENALRNPDINYIGIEKYESVLVRALQKVDIIPPNLRFMCIDALTLRDYFNHNVDQIFLNFSDPWPKKRHAKRRLTSPVFLDLYNKISRDSINIKMKTDNKGLFAYSIKEFNNNGFFIEDISLDLPEDYENNIMTEYEKKFRKENININYVKVKKEVKYGR